MRQEKKKESDTASGLATAGRFIKSEAQSKESDPVKRLQDYAKSEMERKRKEEEEKKKKKGVVEPPKGILQRAYEYFAGSSEKK